MRARRPVCLAVTTRVRCGYVDVLHVSGEVDARTAPRLGGALDASLARGTRVLVIDLTDVAFCDSAGLATLVGARKRLPAGGGIRLVGCGRQILMMLGVTGLGALLPAYASLEEALAAGPRPH